nr:hypothetical protein [Uliginosibacterium gangwonense]
MPSGSNHHDCFHRKLPDFRQQRLKGFARTAGAGVLSAKFFEQFLVAMNDAETSANLGFRREAFTTLAGDFEMAPVLGFFCS